MPAYRIQLLGKLQVEGAETTITRFRTRKTALLLAYLAYHVPNPALRETLIDSIWPELDADAGRNNLSTALSSLRRQMETPDMASGTILLTDRNAVQLRPEAIVTDVTEFDTALRVAAEATQYEKARLLEAALKRYTGPLLSDYEADWITPERLRWEETYRQAREQLDALPVTAQESAIAATNHRPTGQKKQLPVSLPLGTVTILAAGHPGAAWGAFEAEQTSLAVTPTQHAILQNQCRRFGGFETARQGKAFVGLFASATDALDCALDCRATLAAQPDSSEGTPFALCMALHTGEVETEEDANCGAARTLTLRLLEAGHGGQTLGTKPFASLFGKASSDRMGEKNFRGKGLRWKDLGEYRLDEGASAERLFQIEVGEQRDHSFPPLHARRAQTETLPVPLNRFFGREAELARVTELFCDSDARLVTLTGMGGAGKTRLAIEIGHRVQATFPGLVWFVSLADVEEVGLLAPTLCRTLKLPLCAFTDSFEQICDFFRAQESPTLLILDNFEALVEEGAEWIQRLLTHVPNLACLLTSRQALELPGEQEQSVPPLPTPVEGCWLKVEGNNASVLQSSITNQQPVSPQLSTLNSQLLASPAVQMFVNRAQAVKPDFQITPGNAAAVAQCCIALEGIPLAIELATARAQVMTPAEMLDALRLRFDFLTTRRRNVVPRHQALRAVIDWSYARLRPELQQFFAQLSVFRDGWTAQEATEVCHLAAPSTLNPGVHPQGRTQPSTLIWDWLQELRGHSFVGAQGQTELSEMRFYMLETLREYGEEKLSRLAQNALRNRHLACFLRLAESAAPHLHGPEQAHWLARLEAEHANLRAALMWSLRNAEATDGETAGETGGENMSGEAEAALRLAGALGPFFQIRGYVQEGRRYLQAALDMGSGTPTRARAHALNEAGALAQIQGDYAQARSLYTESLEIWQTLAHEQGIANALNNLGLVAELQGDFEAAERLYTQGMEIRQRCNDRAGLAASYNNLGILTQMRREYATARVWYERSLDIKRELEQWRGVASTLNNLGNIAHAQGDYAASQAYHQESLALRERLGDRQGIAGSLNNLGMVAEASGKFAEARDLYARSLAIKTELGDRQGIAMTLHNMANLARLQGDLTGASATGRQSLQIQQVIGDKHAMTGSLHALAAIAHAQGHAKRAARLYAAHAALCEAMGLAHSETEQAEQGAITSELRDLLGVKAFAREQAVGTALTLEQAVAYALSAA